MTSSTPGTAILAIETAVGSGGAALFLPGSGTISAASETGLSRAEEIIPNIEDMLATADMRPSEIGLIAVSLGPGSYTGLRIGLAFAKGLSAGLGITLIGVAPLRVMAETFARESTAYAVIPMGRTDLAWQFFDCGVAAATPVTGSVEAFTDAVGARQADVLVCHSAAAERIADRSLPGAGRLVDVGVDLAALIAASAAENAVEPSLDPIYVADPGRSRGLF